MRRCLSLLLTLAALFALAGCPSGPPTETASTPPSPTHAPQPTAEPEPASEPEPAESTGYDMGDVPEFENGYIVRAVVPPAGTEVDTEDWPAVLWFDVNDTKLVMYARHEQAYDPETETGRLVVWVGCPWQYVAEVEADHLFGSADAAAYLAAGGIKSVGAEVYIGPGDKSGPGSGYEEWTSQTDRCTAMVLEPKRRREHQERLTVWAETDEGRVDLYRGVLPCRCPDYPDETVDEDWIYVLKGKTVIYAAAQGRLPG